jgi:hypothetical protein
LASPAFVIALTDEIDAAGKNLLKRMSFEDVEFVVAAHATHAITQRSRLQHTTRLYKSGYVNVYLCSMTAEARMPVAVNPPDALD